MNIISKTLAAVGALSMSAPVAAEWHRADTDNFIVFSSGSEKDLRKRTLNLERFDALMRLRYRLPSDPSPNRLTIYLLDDEKAIMRAIACRKYGGVAGFYSDQLDGSYFVSHRRKQSGRTALQPEVVQFHEYSHHFMFRYFPFAYPGWYREGFAEYYGTVEFDDEGNWNYGKPPVHRGGSLINGRQIPVDKMLTVAQKDLSPEESYQVYTRGWMLTHLMHSDPERGAQLNRYLLALAEGKDRATAANESFGDLDVLEKELKQYMRKSPTYIQGREPIEYAGRFDVRTLDDVETRYEQLRLDNRRSCDNAETRDELRELAAEAPGNVDVQNLLADAEHILAHRAASKAWAKLDDKDADRIPPQMNLALVEVEKALAINPDHGRANALKAEFLLDVGRHTKDEATLEGARTHAIKANRANPDNPFPLSLYYQTYAEAGADVSVPARAALARAFELAPEAEELRVDYALDLALQGDFERAVGVVEFLIGSPHSEKRGRLALMQIASLKEGTPYSEVKEMKLPDDDEEGDEDSDA